jgi:hypothetical protein
MPSTHSLGRIGEAISGSKCAIISASMTSKLKNLKGGILAWAERIRSDDGEVLSQRAWLDR